MLGPEDLLALPPRREHYLGKRFISLSVYGN
jgi:hypothetical protein